MNDPPANDTPGDPDELPYRSGDRTLPEPAHDSRKYIRDLSQPGRPGHLRLVPRRRPWLAIGFLSVLVLLMGVLAPSTDTTGWVTIAVLAPPCLLGILFFSARTQDIRIEGDDLVKKNHLHGIGRRTRVPWLGIETIRIVEPDDPMARREAGPSLLIKMSRHPAWPRSPMSIAEFLRFDRADLQWIRTYLLTAIEQARARRDAE